MIRFKDFYNLYTEGKYTSHRDSPKNKLLKYVDDPNCYVTFTKPVDTRGDKKRKTVDTWEKVGVNPYNEFRTPTAIYTYPLNKSKNYIEYFEFPYAARGATSAWVLRVKNPENIAKGSTYTKNDLLRDVEVLQEIYENVDMMDIIKKFPSEYKETPIQTFWSLTRELAYNFTNSKPEDDQPAYNPPMVKWAYLLNYFYDGFEDDLEQGFIHMYEPVQACFFSKSYLETVEHISEPEGFNEDNWFHSYNDSVSFKGIEGEYSISYHFSDFALEYLKPEKSIRFDGPVNIFLINLKETHDGVLLEISPELETLDDLPLLMSIIFPKVDTQRIQTMIRNYTDDRAKVSKIVLSYRYGKNNIIDLEWEDSINGGTYRLSYKDGLYPLDGRTSDHELQLPSVITQAASDRLRDSRFKLSEEGSKYSIFHHIIVKHFLKGPMGDLQI